MIGIKMALTGLMMLVFCIWIYGLAKTPPVQQPLKELCAAGAILGLIAIPVGLLVAIWS